MKDCEEYASEAIAAFPRGVDDAQFEHVKDVIRRAMNEAIEAAAKVVHHDVDGPMGRLSVGDEELAAHILALRQ